MSGVVVAGFTTESAGVGAAGGGVFVGVGVAVGRRKRAVARVRVVAGSGRVVVNGRDLVEYFPNRLHRQLVLDPLRVLGFESGCDVVARIGGGGVAGQAGALRLAIARALNGVDVEGYRPVLKRAGFLRRDDRVIERKKAGLKKARKAPQYSKR